MADNILSGSDKGFFAVEKSFTAAEKTAGRMLKLRIENSLTFITHGTNAAPNELKTPKSPKAWVARMSRKTLAGGRPC